jgi:hypothetical protein
VDHARAPGDDGGTGRRVRFTPHRGHDGEVWRPVQSEPGRGTVVRFDAADTVWRLGTRMISPAEAVAGRGDRDDELAQQVLQIVCIIR